MKYQAEYLLKHKTENIFFINILDGNACYIALDKFNYLVNKSGYENIKKYIFVGDMCDFQKFWLKLT